MGDSYREELHKRQKAEKKAASDAAGRAVRSGPAQEQRKTFWRQYRGKSPEGRRAMAAAQKTQRRMM